MCESNNMQRGSNTVFSFTLGALLGAGLGYFATTKKGKRIIRKYIKKLEPYLSEVSEDVYEEAEDIVKAVKKPFKKTLFKGL